MSGMCLGRYRSRPAGLSNVSSPVRTVPDWILRQVYDANSPEKSRFIAVNSALFGRQKRIYRVFEATTVGVVVFDWSPCLNCVSCVEILHVTPVGVCVEVRDSSFDFLAV